jgi:hypothetical protein
MKKHLSKRRVVLAAIVAVVLAIGSGIAYAYWTSGGSGTGSAATAAAATDAIRVTATVSPDIYPGETSTVSFSATNSASSSSPVGTIHLDSVTAPGLDYSACQTVLDNNPDQFQMEEDVSVATVIPANTTITPQVLTQKGFLHWDDGAYSQDACKDVTFTLTFTTS